MANLRTGGFGTYYGSYFNESEPLSQSEMELNATYIYSYLNNMGWTLNSISALLGNLQAESTINPGRWQSDSVGSNSNGYGLVQWTPATKYIEWLPDGSDASTMDNNISRILYELANGIQWIATSSYNLTFKEFSNSNNSVEYLSKAFLLNYERPADQSESVQNYRASLGAKWYSYLTGETPSGPGQGPTAKAKRKFNFLIFNARKRMKQWIN